MISTALPPLQAVFEHYWRDVPCVRIQPPDDRWFHAALQQPAVQGVIFHLPEPDDIYGWSYPPDAAVVTRAGLPHLVIRHDVRDESPPGAIQRELQSFIESLQAECACRAQPDMTSHSNDKQLACTLAAGEKQKTWFAGLRREVFEVASPMPSSTPTPRTISSTCWAYPSSPTNGGRRSSRPSGSPEEYLDAMNAQGYNENPASTAASVSPPARSIRRARPLGRPAQARAAVRAPHLRLLAAHLPAVGRPDRRALLPARSAWHLGAARQLVGALARPLGRALRARRLDFAVDELKQLITVLEGIGAGASTPMSCVSSCSASTSRKSSSRSCASSSPRRPRPVRVTEQITNVMSTQWHRGSEWALSHARAASARKCRRVSMLASLSAPLSASA